MILSFGVVWRMWNIKEEKKEAQLRDRLIEEGWGIQHGAGEKGKARVVRDFATERGERTGWEQGEGRERESVGVVEHIE